MTKSRLSNIELLRIISMFMVLLVHANFWSLGNPMIEDFSHSPVSSIMRVFVESFVVPCVNIFVMISGWFGIKLTLTKIAKFGFMCLFYSVLIYLFTLCVGLSPISASGLLGVIYCTEDLWFVKSFFLLMILSPVLNTFVENTSRYTFRLVLISFFIFECVYGWVIGKSCPSFESGYSTISFIGLYLLARYIRVYSPSFANYSIRIDFLIIIVCTLIVAFFYILAVLMGLSAETVAVKLMHYSSPFVIVMAMYWVVSFSKIRMKNDMIVNFIAASCFSVYLVHMNPNLMNVFKSQIINIAGEHPLWSNYALLLMFLLVVYCVCIVIDQLRILIEKKLFSTNKSSINEM